LPVVIVVRKVVPVVTRIVVPVNVWVVVPVNIVASAAVCVIWEVTIVSGSIPVLTNWALVFKS
jgi:hypothetical protein